MNKQLITIAYYFLSLVFGSVLFVLLFQTPIAQSMILFYRGLFFLGIVGAVMWIALSVFRKRFGSGYVTRKDILFTVVVTLCLNLVFFTHVPVTADRSLTIFLLREMRKNSTQIYTKDVLRDSFLTGYIIRDDATEKRLKEQIASGTIRHTGNGYQITQRGMLVLTIYEYMSNLFGLPAATSK